MVQKSVSYTHLDVYKRQLPTWFTIRVNKHGYVARKSDIEILVAMNPQTAIEDVKSLSTGAVCISPVELKLDAIRKDVVHYQVPFTELAAKASENLKLRKLLMNMLYVCLLYTSRCV